MSAAVPKIGAKPPLFVCSYNAIRSPMAAGLYAHLSGGQAVGSAGVEMQTIHPLVFAALSAAQIATPLEEGAPLDALDLDQYGAVLALSLPAQRALEASGTVHEFWDLADFEPLPIGEGNRTAALAPFLELRDTLLERITERFSFAG